MAQFEIVMPKMGESIEEATITKWFVKEGDEIQEDDVLLEIATDKVDSEIPSPVAGRVHKIMYKQDETVAVGSVIALLDMGGVEEGSGQAENEAADDKNSAEKKSLKEEGEYVSEGSSTELNKPDHDEKGDSDYKEVTNEDVSSKDSKSTEADREDHPVNQNGKDGKSARSSSRFYSPLVRKIAGEENVSIEELDQLEGSGENGRVQKKDLLKYIDDKKSGKKDLRKEAEKSTGSGRDTSAEGSSSTESRSEVRSSAFPDDEIVEMDRMRKIIAEHMIRSKQTSAHVTNMLECDVTRVVNWRNKIKDEFQQKEGQKITYLPIFLEAAAKAIKDFPTINSSVDGNRIIIKKRINMGVAVSLENNSLIVPVIKNIDNLSLIGITKELNRLAKEARSGKLKPDDILDGTFTVTNFGSFGNTIGTPIINQPQVAILAVGAIEKKPAVVETPEGDVIAIRHKMFLSLTYDHRIIDGSLGGAYLKKVADYIEGFDLSRVV